MTRITFAEEHQNAVHGTENWHCPFDEVSSQSMLPEHPSVSAPQTTNVVAAMFVSLAQPTKHITSHRVSPFSVLPYADPPFENLRTLRI